MKTRFDSALRLGTQLMAANTAYLTLTNSMQACHREWSDFQTREKWSRENVSEEQEQILPCIADSQTYTWENVSYAIIRCIM